MRFYEIQKDSENVKIIREAREVMDIRHVPSDKPFFPEDQKPNYIEPSEGFYWAYHEGYLVLHSTSNDFYDWLVHNDLYDQFQEDRRSVKVPGILSKVWNELGGTVDLNNKVLTISKEHVQTKQRQRAITDVDSFIKALKELKKYGVTDDFKIKGAPTYVPKTVGKALIMTDPKKQIFNDPSSELVMYHGTSEERWEEIQKQGLRPGKTGEAYVDLVPGYSEYNIYLGSNKKIAEFYAKRQSKKDESKPVILQVQVPDNSKIRPGDSMARFDGSKATKKTLRDEGEVAYKGIILPKFIKRIR